jgi:hypothetical protein
VRLPAVAACLLLLAARPASAQTRSFADLCAVDEEQRALAFSEDGLSAFSRGGGLSLAPETRSGISISGPVLAAGPSFLAESLRVVPLEREAGLLRVYNALSRVRGLEGRLYHSFTRDKDIPLFAEAVRIESPRRTAPLPDPPDAAAVPASENVYIRLKDANFGNTYYEAVLTANASGLRYTLSNFRSLNYILVPVIKERRFIAQLYFEFIEEGLLVYSAAGADASDFIASMIDIPSAVEKRLSVIIGWVLDGMRRTDG